MADIDLAAYNQLGWDDFVYEGTSAKALQVLDEVEADRFALAAAVVDVALTSIQKRHT